ncbi:MAG TPA: universal stress protein [Acidobacteriaceae bacterium]|nr:universal stress protein [Acidobacteriaceae bacterium]
MEKLLEDRTAQCDPACPDEIVVATDLADAERLIPYAVAQARLSGAALTFVHAMPPDQSLDARAGVSSLEGQSGASDSRKDAMEEIARRVRAQGISCSTVVNAGPVADVVAEILRRTGAGRLIVGTHARQGVDKLLVGSVARKLLESVDVPVFIVGPQCKGASQTWTLRRILVASSTLEQNAPKTVVADAIAMHCHAELTVLHVLVPSRPATRRTRPAQIQTLTEPIMKAHDEGTGQLAFTRVTAGDPAVEIVRVANEISADLIVLGVHHYPFRLPFGKETTAYKVLASAPCPVLTLKSDSALIRKHALTVTRHLAVQ